MPYLAALMKDKYVCSLSDLDLFQKMFILGLRHDPSAEIHENWVSSFSIILLTNKKRVQNIKSFGELIVTNHNCCLCLLPTAFYTQPSFKQLPCMSCKPDSAEIRLRSFWMYPVALGVYCYN